MDTGRRGVQLLNSLNKFISLTASSATIGHGPDHGFSVSQLKAVANFIRLNVLSPLRRLEPDISIPISREDEQHHLGGLSNDVLVQWWLTLLNFLNSGLISETTSNTSLAMDAVSVSLECISRIITITVPKVNSPDREREIYSYHLLLTVRWVTNRLVLNSRRKSELESRNFQQQQQQQQKQNAMLALQFAKQYTAVLIPLIGKIIAFAFCFLDDELHYDVEVVKTLSKSRFDIVDISSETLLPWRTKQVVVIEDDAQQQSQYTRELINKFNNVELNEPMSQETKKVFPIMISYLQNSQVQTIFLFHYWFNVLNAHSELGLKHLEIEKFPGFALILHFCCNTLKQDLDKLSKFIKIEDKQGKHEAALLKTTPNSNPNQINVSHEKIINFIFTKFQGVRIIECYRSLMGYFYNTRIEKTLLIELFNLQEKTFLASSSSISAYDSWMANIIFNVLFQFQVFHFDTLPEILESFSWNSWINGIFGTLKTYNVDSQLVGLLCLFNTWQSIPLVYRKRIAGTLIGEFWDMLSIDTDFHIVNILFHKLLIFKVLADENISKIYHEAIKTKLFSINKEVLCIINAFDYDYTQLVDEKTVLFFHTNNRLILERQEPLYEDDLLLMSNLKHTEGSMRNANNTLLFTNMSRMSNIRPGVVICKGKHPFDISDELVSRAALMVAQKNKTKRENERNRSSISSSTSSLNSDTSETDDSKKEGGLKFGFGALLSSFNNNIKSKPDTPPKPTQRNSNRNSIASTSTTDTYETHEMLSMYSTVSSVASNSSRSESSEDLLYKLSQQTRSHIMNNNDSPASKKHKILAPVETKYTRDIVSKPPIRFIFKTVSVNSQLTQKKNMLDKIQGFNKKWGVKVVNRYDKPLPDPLGMASDTLIDGFDFDSLSPTIEELQQLNLVENSVSDIYGHDSSQERRQQGGPMEPPQIDISQLSPDDTFMNLTDVLNSTSYDIEKNKPISKVERMKLITKLTKLIKVIHTFNLTMKEYTEFKKVNGNNLVYMELDPGFHQNHSLNKGLIAIASYK